MTSKNKILISKSYDEWFLTKEKEILQKFNPLVIFEYKFSKENDTDIVTIYNKGKVIMKAVYQHIGMFIVNTSTWYWAWNNSFVNKKLTLCSEKVKDFEHVLSNSYDKYDKHEADIFYYYCHNGNFFADIQTVQELVKFTLWINNGLWFFPVPSQTDNITQISYIIINKILQI